MEISYGCVERSKKMKKTVLLCADDNYLPQVFVVLTSLYINNPGLNFHTTVFVDNINEYYENKFKILSQTFNRSIEIKLVDVNLLPGFFVSGHITKSAYLRIFAPDILDSDIILYLDCDLIVETCIEELLNYNMPPEFLVAGVEDKSGSSLAKSKLLISDCYINSGVLLINARQWRVENIYEKIIEYYHDNENKLTWHDQCLINGALEGRKFSLPYRYNLLFNDINNGFIDLNYSQEDFVNCIFHFNSTVKPWHRWFPLRYKHIWGKYSSISICSPLEISDPKTLFELKLLAENYAEQKDYKKSVDIYKNLIDTILNWK